MKFFKKALIPTAVSLSIAALAGCVEEAKNPGINTGSDTTVDRIYFENISNVKFRIENEGKPEQQLIPYYYLSGKLADFETPFLTAPITGMGLKDRVKVEIVSVASVKGSEVDHRLFGAKLESQNQIERCHFRNKTAAEQLREPEICTQEEAVTACKQDPANIADPEAACANVTGPYDVIYKEPVDIDYRDTAAGVFEYKVVAAVDAFGEVIDIRNDVLPISEVISNGEVVGLESDYTTDSVTIGQNSHLKLNFDLPDEPFYWDNQFQAKMKVGNQTFDVMFDTNPRDPTLDDPVEKFKDEVYKNVIPGAVVITKAISFEGHNTRAPIQLIKQSDFVLEYSVDSGPFIELTETSNSIGDCDAEGAICVRSGNLLQLRIHTEKQLEKTAQDPAYAKSYDVIVKVGEGIVPAEASAADTSAEPAPGTYYENTVKVKTHTWDYVPGPSAELSFPNRSSATLASAISIRGGFSITDAMKNYEDEDEIQIPDNEILRPTIATIYRMTEDGLDDSTWQPISIEYSSADELNNNIVRDKNNPELFYFQFKSVPLAADETSKFYVVTESNVSRLTNGTTFYGKSEPIFVDVTQSSSDIATFPEAAATSMVKNMRDGSINPRNGLLYLSDSTSYDEGLVIKPLYGLIWRYDLNATSKPVCMVRPQTRFADHPGGTTAGIQFNHARPHIGGVVVKTGQGPMYLTEEQLHAGPTATFTVTKGKTDLEGNAGREGRMYAWDYQGRYIYSNSHNRAAGNYGDGQEQFINTMSFSTIVQADEKGNIINELVTALKVLGTNGKVAQEAEGTKNGDPKNNGMALDIITLDKGLDKKGKPVIEEWILSLDIANDQFYYRTNGIGVTKSMGAMKIRKLQVNHETVPDYSNPKTNWSDVELLYQDAPVTISDGHAIVIDDKRKMAYIADNFNGKIYKVDISNIDRANSLTVVDIIADNSVSPNKFVRIESMVMEGDLDYIVAIDSEQQTLYLIDPVTGEMTLVLKTLKVKTNANASVCDQ